MTDKLETLFQQAREADRAATQAWRETIYHSDKLREATARHDAARAEAHRLNELVLQEMKRVNAAVKLANAVGGFITGRIPGRKGLTI